MKVNNIEVLPESEILSMLGDIVRFFWIDTDYRTMQQLLSIDKLFQGFVIRNWFQTTRTDKYQKLNYIIAKKYIIFYHQYWIDWNTICHLLQKQNEILN